MKSVLITGVLLALLASIPAAAATPEDPAVSRPGRPTLDCFLLDPPLFAVPGGENRLQRYQELSGKHRVAGLASYYSSFFDGRKTANGEIYRNRKFSAAHLTLPFGTLIEVTARATGKKLRMRVNDRGPFVKKFVLDLSQAAAHALGVDRARDRHVEIRIVALPGEEPLPEELPPAGAAGSSVAVAAQ